MKKIKVSEATNIQLDWLVAKCEGKRVSYFGAGPMAYLAYIPKRSAYKKWRPTTNPAQMWPIIHREVISIHSPGGEPCSAWVATRGRTHQWGADGLIAAARCYVVSKLGEAVEAPDEL